MNILFITRGFPSETDPMLGNYEAVQAKALARKGHQVSVLTIQWKSFRYLFKSNAVEHRVVDGVEVYTFEKLRTIIPQVYWPKFELWWRRFCFKSIIKKYFRISG